MPRKMKLFRDLATLAAIMSLTIVLGYTFEAGAATAKKTVTKRTSSRAPSKPAARPTPMPAPVSMAPVNNNPARETSIDRIVVGLFKANVNNPEWVRLWNQKRREYQAAFVALLNERSYLEATASNQEFTLNESKDVISNVAQRDGVDGALVGEFRGHSIELAIRSGATGRTLARLTVPVRDIATQSVRDISVQAVDQVVLSFPYRGFVVATSGNEVKLNLGRAQGISVGTLLEVFDFEGEAPNFSSPTSRVATIRVVRIASNAAIASVISANRPVTPFAKVSFSKFTEADVATAGQLVTRYHRGFWASLGAEFYYIDTQISDLNSTNLAQRIYQVPLSPALGIGIGYSRLSLWALVSGLSNSSNNVSIMDGTLTYELIRPTMKRFSLITSLGVFYSSYKSTPTATATLPLVSQTTYSPLLEERIQYVSSPQTKLFADGRLYYPIFSSDAVNGNSSIAKSYGFGGDAGLRLDLSKRTAIEGGLQTRYMGINLSNGGSIAEFEYGFFLHLLFMM